MVTAVNINLYFYGTQDEKVLYSNSLLLLCEDLLPCYNYQ
jgi:hypothetical protein